MLKNTSLYFMHSCIILRFMLVAWQQPHSIAAVSLLLLLFGFVWERTAERRDLRLHPAPGRLIAVGDRRLHLVCKGSGAPAVVIEQGAGELSSYWWPMQDEIATFAHVCTYDRAGYAWSDPAPSARTMEDRSYELHQLLTNAGVPGPYILVGHSYGGLMVRDYQRRFPAEVAGLVLVDTPEESSLFQPDVLRLYARIGAMNRIVATVARFGVLRLLRHWLPLDRYGFWLTKPAEYAALCDDLASLKRVSVASRVSEKACSLGSLPTIVITHGRPFPAPFAVMEKNWSEGQKRLAALSSNHLLLVAENSNHMIQHDEPALVLDAIRRMYTAVSTGNPLLQIHSAS